MRDRQAALEAKRQALLEAGVDIKRIVNITAR